jgi:pimeloyl-ACP methyl ester carboxylesterase
MNGQDRIHAEDPGSGTHGILEGQSSRPTGAGNTLESGPGTGITDRLTTGATVVVGAVAAVVGGAVVRTLKRAQRDGTHAPVFGMFGNGMAYLRLGAGPKTLLWIPGGPGNTLPSGGLSLRMGLSWSRPFTEQGYTVWWVTRRQDMPTGHSYADMADDYARLIADEFDGKVDLVLGMSTGGEIGFPLAASHPEAFGHIVILGAGYQENERCKDLNLRSSRLLSQGQTSQAMALMVEDMYPHLPRPARWALGEFMGRSMYGTTHPYFANDVMVEAEAGVAFDARPILPHITVPVLLVCGDQDPYYPKEIYQETARLIPDCTLRMYEGKGHEVDKALAEDVLDFVRQHPTAAPGHATEPPGAR